MFSRLFVLVGAGLLATSLVQAQPQPTVGPARLAALAAPDTLEAGAVGHFRARIRATSTQPVNYLWDLGDGTLSVGALVSHAYAAPGRYGLTVVARNETGADTLRARVAVIPSRVRREAKPLAAPPAVPTTTPTPMAPGAPARPSRVTLPRAALFGGGGVSPEAGGYTWVVQTDLWVERAQQRMLAYRLRGLRADVYVDTTGIGSPAHRIVLGQFATTEQALAARAWMPDGVRGWLMTLPLPTGPAAPASR